MIVLGDARTNGREPHAEVFAQVAERAGRLFWLNPEPKLYWNYGDSVMAAYERYCDGAFECWTTRHLENFVNVVAGGRRRRRTESRLSGSCPGVAADLRRQRVSAKADYAVRAAAELAAARRGPRSRGTGLPRRRTSRRSSSSTSCWC